MSRQFHAEGLAWLRPSAIFIFWIAMVFVALVMSDNAYLLTTRAHKYIKILDALKISAVFLIAAIFAEMGSAVTSSNNYEARAIHINAGSFIDRPELRVCCVVMTVIMAYAYFLWLAPALKPQVILNFLLVQNPTYIRSIAPPTPGVTTFTQLGIVISALAGLGVSSSALKSKRFWLQLFAIVIAFALFRAFIWSERLALIEVILTFAVAVLPAIYRGQTWLRYAPIYGILMVFLIFSFFEYFRSWTFFRDQGQSFFVFAAERFAAYYTTSFNNTAAFMQNEKPSGVPSQTFFFLYNFPNPFGDGTRSINEVMVQSKNFLTRYLTPEFNVYSGPGIAISEIGLLGASVTFAGFGYITGLIHSLYVRREKSGLIFYPMWCVGLFDLGRTLYWTSGRAFPAYLVAAIIVMALGINSKSAMTPYIKARL